MVELDDTPRMASPLRQSPARCGGPRSSFAAAALVVVVVRGHASRGSPRPLDRCDVVIVCWAAAAVATLRAAPRLGWLVISSGLSRRARPLLSARTRRRPPQRRPPPRSRLSPRWRRPLAMAVSVHVLLSLPDGRAGCSVIDRMTAAWWYGVALVVGVYLATTTHVFAPWPVVVGWTLAVATTMPGLYARYADASARWTSAAAVARRRDRPRTHRRHRHRDAAPAPGLARRRCRCRCSPPPSCCHSDSSRGDARGAIARRPAPRAPPDGARPRCRRGGVYLIVVRGLGRDADERTGPRHPLVLNGGAAVAAVVLPGDCADRFAAHGDRLHLRRTRSARRGRAHLRHSPDPRHSDGRAACCSWSSRFARR